MPSSKGGKKPAAKAVATKCDPATTCNGHGKCALGGKCECTAPYTDPTCSFDKCSSFTKCSVCQAEMSKIDYPNGCEWKKGKCINRMSRTLVRCSTFALGLQGWLLVIVVGALAGRMAVLKAKAIVLAKFGDLGFIGSASAVVEPAYDRCVCSQI